MDLGKTGWDGVDWIDLAQNRVKWRVLVNAVLKLWVPQNAGRFSGSAQLHRANVQHLPQQTSGKGTYSGYPVSQLKLEPGT
jgi:hypothetical protein